MSNLWEVAAWKIEHLESCHLGSFGKMSVGKYLTPYNSWVTFFLFKNVVKYSHQLYTLYTRPKFKDNTSSFYDFTLKLLGIELSM